jgi:hypothetical protein
MELGKVKMALDEKSLITKVEKIIRETSFEDSIYIHDLRLEFEEFEEMMSAKTYLNRHYSNRFKISTEIQLSLSAVPNKYHVLMEVI